MEMRFDPADPGLVKFAATEAGLSAAPNFGCQITSIALTPAVQSETLAATLCRPASDVAKPSKWSLGLGFNQDWLNANNDGLSFFLYENDAERMWFSVSHHDTDPPVAVGECTVVAGAFLGNADGVLTSSVTLPCIGKPVISKPSADTLATNATGGTPGDFTGGRDPFTFDELVTIVPAPATAWTTGQYVIVADEQVHWDGNGWQLGVAA